ncbi:zinc finger protein 40 isoform X2 [Eurosta solidaginis]
MDAAATTTKTATTTKHYNKTSKLQNNHRRGTYRTQSGDTNDNVKVQKQTAKQAKAAAQRAAAVAAFTANKTASGAKDPLAIGNDSTTTAAVQHESGCATSGGKAVRAKEAREQKTIVKQAECGVITAAAARGNTTAANPTNAIKSPTVNTSGNNNNNKYSDNNNSSFNKNYITLSQNEVLERKSDRPQQRHQEVSNVSDNKALADITKNIKPAEPKAPTATQIAVEPSTWNNSRYLHKKFKRLASTTDADSMVADSQSVNNAGSSASSEAGSEAPPTRTTSISSSASTSSISPPPACTPTPTPIASTTVPINASSAQIPHTTSNVQNTIAVTGLMNGHAHASLAGATAIEQLIYKNNNKSDSSNNNGSPTSVANHGDSTALHLNPQQQYEADQLPKTMLHIFDNQQAQQNNGNTVSSSTSGRYVCPYCNLNCTKPSVLQKHIRAHTNERPYPCDICGIAFKTNSNYYKHCRSRSHAARKRGIEVPISADDGLFGGSDQEGDPELSNSSSDVISRTASPIDEVSNPSSQTVANSATHVATSIGISPQQLQQLQQQQQKQIQLQHQQQQLNLAMQQQQSAAPQLPHHTALPSIPSPSSISSTKSAYLQQAAQQQAQHLSLGSPAAGTLPPPASANNTANIIAVTSTPKYVGNAVIEHKPYKPKFHNAALYDTTKEAGQAAAAVAATGMAPGLFQPLPLQQQQLQKHHQQNFTAQTPQQQQNIQPTVEQHLSTQAQPSAQSSPAPHIPHHPSLSPSTQVKLNNHINSHQLQLQMQQQQQQHQQYLQQQQQPLYMLPTLSAGLPLHHHVAPISPKSATQRPDLMNATVVAAATNMGYLGAPRMIYPGAMDFPPETLHLMMPESRQKLQYQVQQYKWLEQELQQHLHKLNQQHVQQQHHQQQLQHLKTQSPLQPPDHAPPTPPAILKPTATLPIHPRTLSSHHTTPPPPITSATSVKPAQAQTSQQTPLQYIVNTTAVVQQPNTAAGGGSTNIGMSSVSSNVVSTNNTTVSKSAGVLHSNISNVATASSANKVADLVQEHISKLISQNEAIVENKAVLLQKKYPKGLNRSRSFNNSGNGLPTTTSTSNTGGSLNLVTAISVGNESATNARLAQAIAQKQQQQQQQLQQQLQQQQHYQQQFHQQLLVGGSQMPPPPVQHHQQQQQQTVSQLRFEDQHQQQQQQLLQPNGISKHLTASITTGKAVNAFVSTPQQHMQVFHQQQQQTQQPQQHAPVNAYQQHASIPSVLPPHRAPTRPAQSPGVAQNAAHMDAIMGVKQQLMPANSANINASNTLALPLNLSAKPKTRQEETADEMPASSNTSTPNSTPRKRLSIENQIFNTISDGSTNNALVAPSTVPNTSTASNVKQPSNVSIIKNLLLNARGLAVPTGEGEDAVYNCPLCASTFRTAEDLQLHNSTYCQGASSAPISPVSSPSYRYFRSNSISLNLPELKNSIFRSRDPLPLAKLAWYQLRTKPSSLVLSRLSASQAGSSKATTTTTTSATSTAPTSSTSSSSVASCVASPIATPPTTATAAPPAALILPDANTVRLIDAPLPSPGPLLGKTPLVDFGNTSESRSKSEDVIITKMHEDRQFDEHPPAKRAKLTLDTSEPFVLDSTPIDSSANGLVSSSTTGKRLNINSISGGDMQMLTHNVTTSNELGSGTSKKDECTRRFNSSGGCIIPISECTDVDKSPKMIRTPLLSGGSFQEVSHKPKDKDNKNASALPFPNSSTFTPKLCLPGLGLPTNGPQHFQFPINSITAFNPLTLPPLQSGSGGVEKVIPHVPGIPGPNNLTPQLPPPQNLQLPSQMLPIGRSLSPNRKKTQSPMLLGRSVSPKSLALPSQDSLKSLSPFGGVQNVPSEFDRVPPPAGMRTARNWSQNLPTTPLSNKISTGNGSLDVPRKHFNFTRMAENVSPRKANNVSAPKNSSPENEVRHFNFDNLAKDGGVVDSLRTTNCSAQLTPLHVDINSSVAGVLTSCSGTEPTEAEQKKAKFLRPTSLPLKPGTFTPKRHHGITPTANTLPLISPETPRPSKSCVQLYLNGHAYTYLGLKCSTKMFYCTVNCPQPSYVAGAQKLSMYSVWQVCAENNPHPLGFKPKVVMSLYDSRQKTSTSTMAGTSKIPYSLVVSQQTVMTPFENNQGHWQHHQLKQISLITNNTESAAGDQLKKISAGSTSSGSSGSSSGGGMDGSVKKDSVTGQMLVGGYESHEDYTYIRGRGRGRYVCSECGIRCKKPSMLKKHIRTHTDVRPYTCKHCNFSFKTKGNLTKHMQSKTHYKKCLELGINPGPMPADGEFLEPEPEFDQQSTTSAGGRTSSIPGESDSDDYSDNESESSDTDESKSRLQEHEAARCLLSLSMTPPIGQSISPHPRSESYPYQQDERVDLPTIAFAAETIVASTNTTAPASLHSAHPTNIKRVISFSSPKPPFDYQKQEQYYSNPEESKPKHSSNSTAANYESAPIDLTKPRVAANATSSAATRVISSSACVTNEEYSAGAVVPLPGPPVQTQAQIRDVIFGGSNESGFLKTLISVSDKVRSSTETLENYKNGDELSQAYQYHKAFQYHKIKQIQMNRSCPGAINVKSLNQNLATTSTLTTSSVSAIGIFTTTTPSGSSGTRVSEGVANTVVDADDVQTSIAAANASDNNGNATALRHASNDFVTQENVTTDLELPTIEVNAVSASEVKNLNQVLTSTTTPNSNNKPSTSGSNVSSGGNKQAAPPIAHLPYKSSDEGEDSEYISDQEQTATPQMSKHSRSISNSIATTNSAVTEPHNAKLPAVVAQPGTTDFTGVLSTHGRTVVVGEDGLKKSGNNEIQPVYPRVRMSPDGRPVCKVCTKTFQTQGQLSLHMNIHYMERKFRCEPCGVSFRTQGHLQKHERAEAHKNKVMMTSTFGVPTTSNPRPFECTDCKIAFRIHGHLAKHLRSKTHVQKLECLQKLPFGTYAEIERAGISLTEIDTSDCENSLISLKNLAQKLIEKDPNKLGSYTTPSDMGSLSGNVVGCGAISAGVSGSVSTVAVESTNTNTNNSAIISQDSDSEDIFSAATMAAATAIASLDKDSAANTPRRANSTSEDEAIANGLNNSLKRRMPGNFSNGEESDNPSENCGVGGNGNEKRARVSHTGTTNAGGSPASMTSSKASNN